MLVDVILKSGVGDARRRDGAEERCSASREGSPVLVICAWFCIERRAALANETCNLQYRESRTAESFGEVVTIHVPKPGAGPST